MKGLPYVRALAKARVARAPVHIAEPGRLRVARGTHEAAYLDDATFGAIFPPDSPRVFIIHTRPEPFLGPLRRLAPGPGTTKAWGFIDRGGTLDLDGLLFANRCTSPTFSTMPPTYSPFPWTPSWMRTRSPQARVVVIRRVLGGKRHD